MYLLDTNVVSELRKVRPHGGVLAWLGTVDVQRVYLSAVSLGEIQRGIEITRRQDAVRADELEAWTNQITGYWSILPMDVPAFRVWGRLMHRRSPELTHDAMIAATAQVHGMAVVTRNVKHFRDFGVETVNPFSHRH